MTNGVTLPVPAWLRRRIGIWQKRCGLEMWTIVIEVRPKLEKAGATTTWMRGYHNATITFSKKDYDDRTPHEVDLVIVHELYHLIAAREDDKLEDLIGATSYVYKAYGKEQELIADTWAHALVNAFKRKRG